MYTVQFSLTIKSIIHKMETSNSPYDFDSCPDIATLACAGKLATPHNERGAFVIMPNGHGKYARVNDIDERMRNALKELALDLPNKLVCDGDDDDDFNPQRRIEDFYAYVLEIKEADCILHVVNTSPCKDIRKIFDPTCALWLDNPVSKTSVGIIVRMEAPYNADKADTDTTESIHQRTLESIEVQDYPAELISIILWYPNNGDHCFVPFLSNTPNENRTDDFKELETNFDILCHVCDGDVMPSRSVSTRVCALWEISGPGGVVNHPCGMLVGCKSLFAYDKDTFSYHFFKSGPVFMFDTLAYKAADVRKVIGMCVVIIPPTVRVDMSYKNLSGATREHTPSSFCHERTNAAVQAMVTTRNNENNADAMSGSVSVTPAAWDTKTCSPLHVLCCVDSGVTDASPKSKCLAHLLGT